MDNIDAIIDALAGEIAAQGLRKDEGSPGEDSPSPSPSGSPSSGGEPPGGPPPPPSASPAGPPPPDASPPGGPPPSPGPSDSPAGPPGAGGAPPPDPAQIGQMVQGFDDPTLQAFYAATRMEVQSRGLGAGPGPAAGGMPPPPPPGPEPSAIPGGAPPALKGEVSANGGQVRAGHLGKSESDLTSILAEINGKMDKLAADNADLRKSVKVSDEMVTKAIKLVAGTPLRKGLTEVPFVPRTPEPLEPEVAAMGRPQIDQALKALDKGALKKSDRDAIRKFYDTGGTDATPIRHLLRKQG